MIETHTVPVTIDVEPDVAAALQDPTNRARLEQMARVIFRPGSVEQLFASMDAIGKTARRRGLTDEILEDELAIYNAEKRTA